MKEHLQVVERLMRINSYAALRMLRVLGKKRARRNGEYQRVVNYLSKTS